MGRVDVLGERQRAFEAFHSFARCPRHSWKLRGLKGQMGGLGE